MIYNLTYSTSFIQSTTQCVRPSITAHTSHWQQSSGLTHQELLYEILHATCISVTLVHIWSRQLISYTKGEYNKCWALFWVNTGQLRISLGSSCKSISKRSTHHCLNAAQTIITVFPKQEMVVAYLESCTRYPHSETICSNCNITGIVSLNFGSKEIVPYSIK